MDCLHSVWMEAIYRVLWDSLLTSAISLPLSERNPSLLHGWLLPLDFCLCSFWLLETPPLFSLKVFSELKLPIINVLSVPTLYGLCYLTFPCSERFCSCCFRRLLSEVTRNLLVTLGVFVIGLIPMFLCSTFHHWWRLPTQVLAFPSPPPIPTQCWYVSLLLLFLLYLFCVVWGFILSFFSPLILLNSPTHSWWL